MPYLGIFGSEFEKSYFQIRNRGPFIFLKAQFHEKGKTLKSWTKNTLFGYLLLVFENSIVILKSAP